MVVSGGQVVFEWGNTANNFKAHSMRKSLISALYGIYVDDGVIDLSQTLAELGIDELTPLTEAEKQATVLELLQARSGVYIPAAGESSGMKSDRPQRGSHKHGTHWYYNNWDFNALGTIFDQETGADNIYQAFAEGIASPLGMQDFFQDALQYRYEYQTSQHPYYGFRISARDLARFGQLYLQQGRWEESEIVPADWVAESTRAISRTGKSGTSSGYGYMWWVAAEDFGDIRRGSYCASGFGGHTVEVLPHLDTVIVIRINTDVPGFENLAGAPVDRLIQEILDTRDAR
jgi:CubicO group peptidase (beta-lactamase class C family)